MIYFMRIGLLSLMLVFCTFVNGIFAQKENNTIRKGNKQYNNEQYDAASTLYKKALQTNKHSFEAKFNMADALFKQKKYDDAITLYQEAKALVDKNEDKEKYAAVHHNIGNCFFAKQDFQKSIEAYKEALRANPTDDETRYNLAVAKLMLKNSPQQNQQQDQQQQEQNQQQEQQQQEQNQQQEQKQEEEQQQQQQQDEQQQQNEQQQDELTKQQAEQILQALEQDEQDTQEKVQEAQRVNATNRKQTDKDW